ncbi:bacteriophage antitermination protein Q (plasmid) [Orbus sturtevantii]|uniref:bacteriophage antitermination protein Q n=1 Tax=Orbus sturtevantii TaxID=3074109 RepID=UPI00370D3527
MKIVSVPDRMLNTEFVRKRIFCVYHNFYSSNSTDKLSKSDVNLSNPKHFLKPKRIVDFGSKKILIDAETIRVSETFRYKGSTTLISEINFNHLSWSRAIRELPTFQQAWIKYCYGELLDYSSQIIICQHVWHEFEKEIKKNSINIKSKNKKILEALVWLAVQSSVYEVHYNKKLYSSSYLALLSGKSKNSWSQYFNDKWLLLLGICFNLDKEALINVERNHCK